MQNFHRWIIGLVFIFGASGCDAVFGMTPGTLYPFRVVSGVLTEDTTWLSNQTTRLEGVVQVQSGVTLTIEAGTQVVATTGAALYVHRGARIVARGTKDKPIVFTSAAKFRAAGDWHGLFLCGQAPINGAPKTGFVDDASPLDPQKDQVACGGTNSGDSSGELRFVRIEFGGQNNADGIPPGGLELVGVGSATVIDHVQVHRTVDDGIVIYGGAVPLEYVMVTQAGEDFLDWAYGWRGKLQFFIGTGSEDGLEGGDGEMGDSFENTPESTFPSNATIYNATIVGDPTKTSTGLNLNSGIQGQFFNVLVAECGEWGVSIDAEETKDNAIAGTLDVRNSIFSNMINFDPRELSGSWQAETWLMTDDPTRMNQALPVGKHGIRSIAPGALDFSLVEGAPGLSGAATPPNDGFFDPNATFIGACGKTCPEFEGWTAWPVD